MNTEKLVRESIKGLETVRLIELTNNVSRLGKLSVKLIEDFLDYNGKIDPYSDTFEWYPVFYGVMTNDGSQTLFQTTWNFVKDNYGFLETADIDDWFDELKEICKDFLKPSTEIFLYSYDTKICYSQYNSPYTNEEMKTIKNNINQFISRNNIEKESR